jgi:hypothetical protein
MGAKRGLWMTGPGSSSFRVGMTTISSLEPNGFRLLAKSCLWAGTVEEVAGEGGGEEESSD